MTTKQDSEKSGGFNREEFGKKIDKLNTAQNLFLANARLQQWNEAQEKIKRSLFPLRDILENTTYRKLQNLLPQLQDMPKYMQIEQQVNALAIAESGLLSSLVAINKMARPFEMASLFSTDALMPHKSYFDFLENKGEEKEQTAESSKIILLDTLRVQVGKYGKLPNFFYLQLPASC